MQAHGGAQLQPAALGWNALGRIHELATAKQADEEVASLFEEGRFKEALLPARRSLEIRERILGAGHQGILPNLGRLGTLHEYLGEAKTAKVHYERALAICRRLLGENDPRTATSLDNLGNLLQSLGNYQAARPLLERGLAIREEILGPHHVETALSLGNLGVLLARMGELQRSKALLSRALKIQEEALGPEHRGTAVAINNYGHILLKLGNMEEGRRCYERSLAIREKVLGPHHPDTARAVANLGAVYERLGELQLARKSYLRALRINEDLFGPNHLDIAFLLSNLGGLLLKLGDHDGAEQQYLHALRTTESIMGPDHLFSARILSSIGVLLQEQGDLQGAKEVLEKALAIREGVLGSEHTAVARTILNLGSVLQSLGDHESATVLYRRSLRITQRKLGLDHPRNAVALNNLGSVLAKKGDSDESRRCYDRALAIRRKALGPNHPDTARSLANLAAWSLRQGDYKSAKSLNERALRILEKALGPKHPDVARGLNNRGIVLKEMGDAEGATESYLRALAIYEETYGDVHPESLRCLANLSILRQSLGDLQGALGYVRRAVEAEERFIRAVLPHLSPRRRLLFKRTFQDSTHHAVSLQAERLNTHPGALQLALTTILRRKGRTLQETILQLQALQSELGPEERRLLSTLQADASQRAYWMMHRPVWLDPLERSRRIEALDRRIQASEEDLASRSRAFRKTTASATVEALQKSMAQDTVWIEIFRYRRFVAGLRKATWSQSRYAAYVISKTGPPRFVSLGEAEVLEEAVRSFRRAISARSPQAMSWSRELDRLIMSEIRPLLGNARGVIISPDGGLNLLPFAALVDESGRYLLERFVVSYASSGRESLPSSALPSREPALILGGADFDSPVSQASTQAQGRGDLGRLRFRELPGSAAEAAEVGALLGVPEHRILTGKRADEASLKQLKGPRILHIATHGFFLGELPNSGISDSHANSTESLQDPFLRSGLALSGANNWRRSAGPNDGLLTAAEVSGLDLWGTQMVVLSACGTGLGQVEAGEGVYGLRRALVLAGSRTQVLTLWDIDDHVTRRFMLTFYELLSRGVSRAEALRRTQLALLGGGSPLVENRTPPERGIGIAASRNQGADMRTRHPYFWAGFILSGDRGPLPPRGD